MSFAYWDQRFLQQKRLLDPQTGELMRSRSKRWGIPTGDR